MSRNVARFTLLAALAATSLTVPLTAQQQGVSLLLWNKPIVLGVIDPPGTGTHIEIEVQAEQRAP